MLVASEIDMFVCRSPLHLEEIIASEIDMSVCPWTAYFRSSAVLLFKTHHCTLMFATFAGFSPDFVLDFRWIRTGKSFCSLIVDVCPCLHALLREDFDLR